MFRLHLYIIDNTHFNTTFLMSIFFLLLGATKIVPVEAAPQESEPTTPEATVQDPSQRRGYQEYAIQQTPYEQAMKSSR